MILLLILARIALSMIVICCAIAIVVIYAITIIFIQDLAFFPSMGLGCGASFLVTGIYFLMEWAYKRIP